MSENNLPEPDEITFESPQADPVLDGEILEAARQQLCPACDVGREAEDVRLRALAEMENFKKRLSRDRDEHMAYANEKLMGELIPILDNFDLAMQYGSTVTACKDVLTGVEMTRKLLLDTLRANGLDQLGRPGEEFDPNLHEAIDQESCEDTPPGHIIRVMQKGYKLKDRLLRPAKVVVNSRQDGAKPNKINVRV